MLLRNKQTPWSHAINQVYKNFSSLAIRPFVHQSLPKFKYMPAINNSLKSQPKEIQFAGEKRQMER